MCFMIQNSIFRRVIINNLTFYNQTLHPVYMHCGLLNSWIQRLINETFMKAKMIVIETKISHIRTMKSFYCA